MPGFEWYLDFVDKEFEPTENHIIALFRITPAPGISLEEAAGRVASESSIGTWTTLTTLTPDMRSLMAKAYWFNGPYVKIAYPLGLFEEGSLPQLLSSVAGNVFGMRALRALRLVDIRFPAKYIEYFKGPQHGVEGVRRILGVKDRPITASVPKPKVGMDPQQYAEAAYQAWSGGIDLVKDDENLTSISINRFEDRLKAVMRMRDKAEAETGERKGWLANITGETSEMIRRAKLVADYGNHFIMIDILTAGWAALQTLRDVAEEYGLAIHAHRAFHAAFTRSKRHGVSMLVVAKLARLVGVDHIHVGTPLGKMAATRREVLRIKNAITAGRIRGGKLILGQDWRYIKPVVPVASGGLHPGLIPRLIEVMGRNIMIQVGGGVWGHPRGGRAGAIAVRQAIDAAMNNVPLEEYAETHVELREALEKWGYVRPK